MSIKVILFDLDGTLIDSENHYVLGTMEWLSKSNVNISFDEACKIIGLTEQETYNYIHRITGLSMDTIIEKNTEYFSIEKPIIFRDLLFKDVIPCLRYLKNNNVKIGICSMSSKLYIERFIDECSLNDYFDMVISGDECEYQKPNPEIYMKSIKKFGVPSNEVLIIEDATTGILAAKNSGAYVIARNARKYGLNQEDALILFEDLKELNTIIMEINNGKYDKD